MKLKLTKREAAHLYYLIGNGEANIYDKEKIGKYDKAVLETAMVLKYELSKLINKGGK